MADFTDMHLSDSEKRALLKDGRGKRHDGGPAFPHQKEGLFGMPPTDGGMTLRDYFAGQALAGLLSPATEIGNDITHQQIASACYGLADAMLTARQA